MSYIDIINVQNSARRLWARDVVGEAKQTILEKVRVLHKKMDWLKVHYGDDLNIEKPVDLNPEDIKEIN